MNNLSFVINLYKNNIDKLDRLFNSLMLNSNMSHIEIIVVFNDKDNKNLIEHVKNRLDSNKKVLNYKYKIIINKENLGLLNSRIIGAMNCSNDYILFFDADDCLIYNYDEIIQRNIELSNNADILCFNSYYNYWNGKSCISYGKLRPNAYVWSFSIFPYEVVNHSNILWSTWSFIIKRSFFLSLNINFINTDKLLEDIYLYLTIMSLSDRVYITTDAYYLYINYNDGKNHLSIINNKEMLELFNFQISNTIKTLSNHIKTKIDFYRVSVIFLKLTNIIFDLMKNEYFNKVDDIKYNESIKELQFMLEKFCNGDYELLQIVKSFNCLKTSKKNIIYKGIWRFILTRWCIKKIQSVIVKIINFK